MQAQHNGEVMGIEICSDCGNQFDLDTGGGYLEEKCGDCGGSGKRCNQYNSCWYTVSEGECLSDPQMCDGYLPKPCPSCTDGKTEKPYCDHCMPGEED
jgi:hypothetical protein